MKRYLRGLRRLAAKVVAAAQAPSAPTAPAPARGAAPTATPAAIARAQELLRTAQGQRDEARAQLREAREELRELRHRPRVTFGQPAPRRPAVANAEVDADLPVVPEPVDPEEALRSLRQQRDRAAADRIVLRDQRDELRAELDTAANPDFASCELFARLRGADAPGTPLRTMAYGPVGPQNPVLSLLYARCPEQGIDPVPVRRIAVDQPLGLPAGSVLNLHWTRFVQLGCATAADAGARTDQLLATLHAACEAGVRLVWTVHEELPHDCHFPEIEVKLRTELAELATAVHVLHPSTVEAVKPYYELDPAKVLVAEHPLYTGIYPDFVTRESARRSLALDDDEFTILVFGTIRPYKGIDRLLATVADLRRRRPDRRVRLLVAGPTFDSVDSAQLLLRARATPGVVVEPRPVHPFHVQHLFRAADLVALPYNDFLNSGVLLLALTFGRPVLAPENPVTADMVSSGLVRLFERTSDAALATAVEAAVCEPGWLPTGPLDADFAARHDPVVVAGRFAEGLVALAPPVEAP